MKTAPALIFDQVEKKKKKLGKKDRFLKKLCQEIGYQNTEEQKIQVSQPAQK